MAPSSSVISARLQLVVRGFWAGGKLLLETGLDRLPTALPDTGFEPSLVALLPADLGGQAVPASSSAQ